MNPTTQTKTLLFPDPPKFCHICGHKEHAEAVALGHKFLFHYCLGCGFYNHPRYSKLDAATVQKTITVTNHEPRNS